MSADESKQNEHRERQQRARDQMQAEYTKQSAEEKKREREMAQNRRHLKLGITEADLKDAAKASAPRFDALRFVREQIAAKPLVVFSKTWCPYSRWVDQLRCQQDSNMQTL